MITTITKIQNTFSKTITVNTSIYKFITENLKIKHYILNNKTKKSKIIDNKKDITIRNNLPKKYRQIDFNNQI